MILQQIKNLWFWSKLPPPKDAYFKSEKGVAQIVNSTKVLQKKATVISYKHRDLVKEIIQQETNE